ncbi:MAG: Nre family DNA repair protein, partial [Candidatus Thermoplasmatota archaeon]
MKTKPKVFVSEEESICIRCRGAKLLCGKKRCPVLLKYYKSIEIKPFIEKKIIYGSSPPSIFVGRTGYPKVYAGPMLPPFEGDTSLMDTPELWHGKSIDEIVDFRMKLIRGKKAINVFDKNEKIISYLHEIAMANKPIDMEVEFEKKPSGKIALYDEASPHGPSAPIKKIWIENPKVNPKMEKVYYDEMKAKEAVIWLYNEGIYVSAIQRALSAGLLGLEKRLVPTRWGITAVDDMIGKEILEEVKRQPWIDEYRVYFTKSLDNLWVVFMYPSSWQYELIEAWYPNTSWNPTGKKIVLYGDHEYFYGRSSYASIGGCYYAARLASAELLKKEKKQAGVIVLREIHPGYIMPVGVWNVRENVRFALRKEAKKFSDAREAILFISSLLHIPIKRWIESSELLKNLLMQKKL